MTISHSLHPRLATNSEPKRVSTGISRQIVLLEIQNLFTNTSNRAGGLRRRRRMVMGVHVGWICKEVKSRIYLFLSHHHHHHRHLVKRQVDEPIIQHVPLCFVDVPWMESIRIPQVNSLPFAAAAAGNLNFSHQIIRLESKAQWIDGWMACHPIAAQLHKTNNTDIAACMALIDALHCRLADSWAHLWLARWLGCCMEKSVEEICMSRWIEMPFPVTSSVQSSLFIHLSTYIPFKYREQCNKVDWCWESHTNS